MGILVPFRPKTCNHNVNTSFIACHHPLSLHISCQSLLTAIKNKNKNKRRALADLVLCPNLALVHNQRAVCTLLTSSYRICRN